MKKFFSLLLLAAALTVSCEKQQESNQPLPKGKAVEFSAMTSSINTKTEYSGGVVGGKEAIKWVNLDRFTVLCNEVQSPEQKYATYKVNVSGSTQSIVPNNPEVQLMWGEGTHTFYAAYPAENLYDNVLSASISDSQRPSNSGARVFKPQLSTYGFMVATAQATPADGTVNLNFKPMFSNIEFTVGPGSSTDVTVTGFSLKAEDASTPLAGDFTITMAAGSEPQVTVGSNTSNEITVNIGTVTIPKNETMTIPVLAIPTALTGLTAIFTIQKGEGAEAVTEELALPLKKNDAFITFAAGKKSRINAPAILGPEATEAGITAVINSQDVDDYTIDVPQP